MSLGSNEDYIRRIGSCERMMDGRRAVRYTEPDPSHCLSWVGVSAWRTVPMSVNCISSTVLVANPTPLIIVCNGMCICHRQHISATRGCQCEVTCSGTGSSVGNAIAT